jgi:hypothetical protein
MSDRAPVIASAGVPPDLHAERIVGEMLRWLHAERVRLIELAAGAIDIDQMGTVAGQQRVLARLRQKTQGMALDLRLAAAKRGKFTLTLASWSIWDPAADAAAKVSQPPPAAWLSVALSVFTGAGHRRVTKTSVPLLVTRHACVRLAQRAGVRTVDGLVAAMGELWRVTAALMSAQPDSWADPPDSGWFLPIRAADGETLALAVLERARSGDRRLVVKTILDADMADGAMGPTHQALQAALAAAGEDRDEGGAR